MQWTVFYFLGSFIPLRWRLWTYVTVLWRRHETIHFKRYFEVSIIIHFGKWIYHTNNKPNRTEQSPRYRHKFDVNSWKKYYNRLASLTFIQKSVERSHLGNKTIRFNYYYSSFYAINCHEDQLKCALSALIANKGFKILLWRFCIQSFTRHNPLK